MNEECYKQCLQKDDWPALTVEEGNRFRNCLTKYNVWWSSLDRNIQHSAYRYNMEKLYAEQAPEMLDGSVGHEGAEFASLGQYYMK